MTLESNFFIILRKYIYDHLKWALLFIRVNLWKIIDLKMFIQIT